MKFEKHLSITHDISAIDALQAETGFSKQRLKKIMKQGAVWLTRNQSTRRLRRADARVTNQDELHLYVDDEVLDQTPAQAILIADEKDYSVWYKPAGVLSQGSKWGDHCTIYRIAEQTLSPQRTAFIVHRLDRAASGVILLAHKKKTAAWFSRQFETRQVDKVYQAIVHGHFPEPRCIDVPLSGKSAISHVTPVQYDQQSDSTRVEVNIETGRKHQIRQHLATAGFPIVGDRLYGNTTDKTDLKLVSCSLALLAEGDTDKKHFQLPAIYLPKFD